MKEHKGSLKNWRKYEAPGHGLGYLILGTFVDHPQFAGRSGNTSHVLKHDEATGEIETRNSRYTLLS